MKCMCLRAMAIVYGRHHADIGPFNDTQNIVEMLKNTTSRHERDRLIMFIEKLVNDKKNIKLLLDCNGVKVRLAPPFYILDAVSFEPLRRPSSLSSPLFLLSSLPRPVLPRFSPLPSFSCRPRFSFLGGGGGTATPQEGGVCSSVGFPFRVCNISCF